MTRLRLVLLIASCSFLSASLTAMLLDDPPAAEPVHCVVTQRDDVGRAQELACDPVEKP